MGIDLGLLVGLTVLQVLHSLAPSQSLQYQYVNMTKSWTEAQSYCRQNYTDLVTINSAQELSALMNTTALKSGEVAWIGLYNDINSWRWSLSDDRFYTYGQRDYRSWATGEPNNYAGKESCATIYQYKWNDESCNKKHPFHCFDGVSNSYYYSASQLIMSWYDAQSYCRSHFTDLASARNQSENQKLQSLMRAYDVAWIGMFRDTWKWSDGSNVSFQNWDSGEPNNANGIENCAMLDSVGLWYDTYCGNRHPLFCHFNAKRQILRVMVQSDQNMDDPTVKTAILENIAQKLKKQGMAMYATLKWREQLAGTTFHKMKNE